MLIILTKKITRIALSLIHDVFLIFHISLCSRVLTDFSAKGVVNNREVKQHLTFSSKRFLLTKKGVWDKVDVFIRNYFYDFVLHILFPRNGSIKKGTLVFFIFWPGYFFYFILRSIQPKLRVFCQNQLCSFLYSLLGQLTEWK